MSNPALDWVWAHSESKGAARLVMLSLADSARKTTGNAWPSVSALAKRTKLTERAVRFALRDLEKLGEIVTTLNGGQAGSNLYHLPLVNPERGSPLNDVPPEETDDRGGNPRPKPRNHVPPNPKQPNEPTGDPRGTFLPGTGWVPNFRTLRAVGA